jgi:uncharacterized protein YqhQ
MKLSGIGGQAVIEGVMMRNKNRYSVAVRRPDDEIEVMTRQCKPIGTGALSGIPVIRGVVNFVDSLVLGISTLTYSSSFYEDPKEQKPTKADSVAKAVFREKLDSVIMAVTILVSVALAVGLFMVAPYFISRLFARVIGSQWVLNLVEGLVRVAIFILYLVLISMMKDIKRTFMYHGAEHKCINCVEHGMALTVENVRNSSREHKRCGTSFLFIVMLISVIFFIFIRLGNPFLQILVRLLLVPVIAGVSYEVIRWAGKSESKAVMIVSKPGMWLQHLTTREPDDDMIRVGIKAVEAVFDWRSFLDEYYAGVADEDIPEEAYYYLDGEEPEEFETEAEESGDVETEPEDAIHADDVQEPDDIYGEDVQADGDVAEADDMEFSEAGADEDMAEADDMEFPEAGADEDMAGADDMEFPEAEADEDILDGTQADADYQDDDIELVGGDEAELEPEITEAGDSDDMGVEVPIFKQRETEVTGRRRKRR